MARRKKGNIVNGWINLDKPYDFGSTDAVNRIRRLLNAQKAGHGGTLDPLATGILPIALGEATKMIPYCQDQLKTYDFRVNWGEARDTDDAEGDVIATSDARPTKDAIEAILNNYIGDIIQTPPKFSAIKINGQRAYDLAREGKDVDIKAREVYVKTLELKTAEVDYADFTCRCGKGTYIRSLGRDMAEELGTCGYISELRRTSVGPMTTDNAISLAKLEEILDSATPEDIMGDVLLPVETVLDDISVLAISEQEAVRLKNGQRLSFVSRHDVDRLHQAGFDLDHSSIALAVYNDKAIAMVTVDGADISPSRVFNL